MYSQIASRDLARHNMFAYRILLDGGAMLNDNDDDGESAAGGRLAHLMGLMVCLSLALFAINLHTTFDIRAHLYKTL